MEHYYAVSKSNIPLHSVIFENCNKARKSLRKVSETFLLSMFKTYVTKGVEVSLVSLPLFLPPVVTSYLPLPILPRLEQYQLVLERNIYF